MIVKHLTQCGNSKAILIDKTILQAANLSDDVLFALSVNPNGGITIQSIDSSDTEIKQIAFKKVMKENDELIQKLANK